MIMAFLSSDFKSSLLNGIQRSSWVGMARSDSHIGPKDNTNHAKTILGFSGLRTEMHSMNKSAGTIFFVGVKNTDLRKK